MENNYIKNPKYEFVEDKLCTVIFNSDMSLIFSTDIIGTIILQYFDEANNISLILESINEKINNVNVEELKNFCSLLTTNQIIIPIDK